MAFIDLDITKILEWLSTTSLDRIFILIGLVLLVIGIVGSFSGKFELDGRGRVIAGVLGLCLVVGGLLASFAGRFKVVKVIIQPLQTQYDETPCPVEVTLNATIQVNRPGQVIYSYEFSDHTTHPEKDRQIEPGKVALSDSETWKVLETSQHAWAKLKVLVPDVKEAKADIRVTCSSKADLLPEVRPETQPQKKSGPSARVVVLGRDFDKLRPEAYQDNRPSNPNHREAETRPRRMPGSRR